MPITPVNLFWYLFALAGGVAVIGLVCIVLAFVYFAIIGASQRAVRDATREVVANEPRR